MTRFLFLFMTLLTACVARGESQSQKTRLYIIHGYAATPSDHWFQWLKKEVEKEGVNTTILAMPTPLEPQPKEWLEYLQKSIISPDENTFFIAHSLGSITLLRYLESLPSGKKIGGYILVSGFNASVPILPQLDTFTKEAVNYKHLKEISPRRIVIGASDDSIVPYALTEELGKALDAKNVKVEKGGHFLGSDGFTQFPLLLSEFNQLKK